ncbi:MAG: hypothetical protein WBE13_08415 [Candidatus Acidiferrum sp.]
MAAALRESGIPANAQSGVGGLVGALLKSESKIFVLQSDLERAADVAGGSIRMLPPDSVNLQTCHTCARECSACLAICPACKAVLYVEPLTNSGTEGSADRVPLTEQQKNERIVAVWRGGDPLAVSEVVQRLREAGIRHHVHATEDHLVFELGMPRPKYVVRVFESDAPRAAELLAGIRESLPFGLSFTPVPEEEPTAPLQRSSGRWSPAAATSEVWSGEDASFADSVEACLRENRIGVRRSGSEPGRLQLFVMGGDESAAREIVREIIDGSPLS